MAIVRASSITREEAQERGIRLHQAVTGITAFLQDDGTKKYVIRTDFQGDSDLELLSREWTRILQMTDDIPEQMTSQPGRSNSATTTLQTGKNSDLRRADSLVAIAFGFAPYCAGQDSEEDGEAEESATDAANPNNEEREEVKATEEQQAGNE